MPRRLRAFPALLLAGLLLVAGCITPRHAQPVLERPDAEAALSKLDVFSFEGRAAIRQGEKGTQATLNWSQHGADARLRLSGPFGAGAVSVMLEGAVLSIEDSQGSRLSGPDAEGVLADQLGFTPPIATLRWWLLGLPAPDSQALQTRDEAGRLVRLQQDGWQVEYQEYRDESLPLGLAAMPRRLRATRDTLDLRLVIDNWMLAP
ncbi:MAG: outer rane lipoprotein LolB [Pseudomonadota bacterium]